LSDVERLCEQKGLQTPFEGGKGRLGDDAGRQIVPHSRCGSTERTITDCSKSCATYIQLTSCNNNTMQWHTLENLSRRTSNVCVCSIRFHRACLRWWQTSKLQVWKYDDNIEDNVDGAVIMRKSLWEFHLIHLMDVEQHRRLLTFISTWTIYILLLLLCIKP